MTGNSPLAPTGDKTPSNENAFVKFLLELGPLAAFYITYQFTKDSHGLYAATAVLMGSCMLALLITWLLYRKIAVMPIVTTIVVTIFGGLTLYLQDDLFIKLKPTIVNLIFATLLLGGYLKGKMLIKYVLGQSIDLEDEGWRILTLRWGFFFIFLAILNEIVWRNFPESTWVDFKTYGLLPITIIFSIFQLGTLQKYMISPPEDQDQS